ncbi:hypothetical protein [Demequina sp. NBRC 110051]|uniref:hypothetical protein n=1 Tax=Demequina sp. NBRC 110051 TaxID=1570340 RepID=UPI0009FEF5C6|nr:hypothetical protein [Demequina sp. NBRC 110051]
MAETPVAGPRSAASTADAVLAYRRPVAVGVATVAVLGLVTWKIPVLGVALAVGVAGLSWRLRGSRLSPWRPMEPPPVPIDVSPGQTWTFARNLVWRWDDACVNAGLGEFVDDHYTYAGLTLVGLTESAGTVVAHALLAPGQTAATLQAAQGRLAAGLEVARATATVTGDDVAIAVVPVEAAGEWT